MFIPKWVLMDLLESKRNLERRVKRLEIILLKEAEETLSRFEDESGGLSRDEEILSIKKIIDSEKASQNLNQSIKTPFGPYWGQDIDTSQR